MSLNIQDYDTDDDTYAIKSASIKFKMLLSDFLKQKYWPSSSKLFHSKLDVNYCPKLCSQRVKINVNENKILYRCDTEGCPLIHNEEIYKKSKKIYDKTIKLFKILNKYESFDFDDYLQIFLSLSKQEINIFYRQLYIGKSCLCGKACGQGGKIPIIFNNNNKMSIKKHTHLDHPGEIKKRKYEFEIKPPIFSNFKTVYECRNNFLDEILKLFDKYPDNNSDISKLFIETFEHFLLLEADYYSLLIEPSKIITKGIKNINLN
jgi:hypothetical protein